MTDLSSRARALVQSGRGLHGPTDEDRERVGRALEVRLGTSLLLAETSKAAAATTSSLFRSHWPWLAGAVVGAGITGIALVLSAPAKLDVGNAGPVPSATAVAVNVPESAPVPASDSANVAALAPPAAEPGKAPSGATRPARDGLAEEVALLSRATSDLHANKPSAALAVLDEYQRRFPKGQLAQERRAARAQALCALGRGSEAELELARLAPGSLSAARAQQACNAK